MEVELGENEADSTDHLFNEKEMDKIIRQIVDKVRASYFENGEGARGMPGEVKRIIEQNIDRV